MLKEGLFEVVGLSVYPRCLCFLELSQLTR